MAQQSAFDELKRKYRVENKTNRTIFWRDGSWLSGDLPPGEARNVDSDHDADVTIYAKTSGSSRDDRRHRLGSRLDPAGKSFRGSGT